MPTYQTARRLIPQTCLQQGHSTRVSHATSASDTVLFCPQRHLNILIFFRTQPRQNVEELCKLVRYVLLKTYITLPIHFLKKKGAKNSDTPTQLVNCIFFFNFVLLSSVYCYFTRSTHKQNCTYNYAYTYRFFILCLEFLLPA